MNFQEDTCTVLTYPPETMCKNVPHQRRSRSCGTSRLSEQSGSLPDIDIIIVAKLVTDMRDTVRSVQVVLGCILACGEITFRELVHVYIEITSQQVITSL